MLNSCFQKGEPFLLVMEYCEHGSLKAYLSSNTVLVHIRRNIALDAALALEYLASASDSDCYTRVGGAVPVRYVYAHEPDRRMRERNRMRNRLINRMTESVFLSHHMFSMVFVLKVVCSRSIGGVQVFGEVGCLELGCPLLR